ncbi:MAG: SDR family NAD(P)-dependent oxidoreductase [Saprospiraceae bacterium]|nr:SDR family NAD(P)-dependent oxidoreductase [Saprospiraceae bacterium]
MQTSLSTIMITGVSTGIGLAAVDRFHAAGWQVFGTVRKEEDAIRLQQLYPERFHPILFDVTAPFESHEKMIRELSILLGDRGLDVLVQNAGVAQGGPLGWQSEEDVRAIFETNVLGVYKLTKAAIPILRTAPASRMLLISSVSGRLVTPFLGAYAASKFALEAFIDAYRNELGMLGIRVIGIQPGPVVTPIWEKARTIKDKYLDSPYGEILAKQEEFIGKAEANAFPVALVAETIYTAATHPRPRRRYLLVRKPFLVRLAACFPDALRDRLIMSRLKKAEKF